MELIHLEVTDSTNAFLRRRHDEDNVAVWADTQTAGRGQRGNSWHSEPALNLLMSVMWHPAAVPPRSQFAVSEAVALAVCSILDEYGVRAQVKWPNDIYVGNRKICGILIENAIGTQVESCIIGIGLNINQTSFPAELPNPVSMAQIAGHNSDRASVASGLIRLLGEYLPLADSECGRRQLHVDFMSRLWRGDGNLYPFRDSATGYLFTARIVDVEPEGFLHLEDASGAGRRYAFKEVEFLPGQDS